MKKFAVLYVVVLGLILNACGGGDNKVSNPYPEPDKRKLEADDLQILSSTDSYYLYELDRKYKGIVKKVFGGTTGTDLHHFYRERIKHSFTLEELNNSDFTPGRFSYTSWIIDPDKSRNNSRLSQESLTTGAMNIGTLLWYFGALENRTATLRIGGTSLQGDSTRVGIMIFGPGYKKYAGLEDEPSLEYPAEFRNMILLHEARHSDCTGGITQKDLDVIRKAKNPKEFERNFKKFSCGHMHQTCPLGHQYSGQTVCEGQEWGAYAVGTLYALAVLPKFSGTRYERFMRAQVLDQGQRVQIPTSRDGSYNSFTYDSMSELLDGRGKEGRVYGTPDMTSSGVLD